MTEEERCSTVKYAHYIDTLELKSNSLSSLRNAISIMSISRLDKQQTICIQNCHSVL